jgi:hypothetical protein
MFVGRTGKELTMTTHPSIFTRFSKGFKDWIGSFQRSQHAEVVRNDFQDPYKSMNDFHDQEMERLVRAIEQTRDENSMRYQ